MVTSAHLDEVDREMQHVLLQLAMTSEGATANLDGESGRSGDDSHLDIDSDRGTAPEHYRQLYRHAETRPEREALLRAAKLKLDGLVHSQANFDVPDETPDELYDRIIFEGDGFPARAVANNLKTTAQIVWRARREREREEARGRELEDLRGAEPEARRRRVRQLAREYAAESPPLGPRAVARALTLPYSTVIGDLEP